MMKGYRILVFALLVTACGGGDSATAGTVTTALTASATGPETTTTTTTTTATLPPIGDPFQIDTVLLVSGISEVVGQGALAITLADEDGNIELSIDGSVPVVDGETCMFCMAKLELGPGAVAADALFANHPSDGVSTAMSGSFTGPMFPEGSSLFIVAGDGGAVLGKEGAGFRLVEGAAWLVTDRSLIDTAAESATSTEPADGTETMATLFEDQFDGALADEWSWELEAPGQWSLTAVPGWLQLTAADRMQNVLVRETLGGEYEVTTALRFHPTSNFQFAGLIVTPKGQQETFLQLGRAYCDPAIDFCIGDGVYLDNVEDGEMVASSIAKIEPDTDVVYLRLFVDGDSYAGYVSEDGETWTSVGEHTRSLGNAAIGLIAHQAYEEPAVAEFDYVTVTSETITTDAPSTTATEAGPDYPTYTEYLGSLPPGTETCNSRGEVSEIGGGLVSIGGPDSQISMRDGQMVVFCPGAKLVVGEPFTGVNQNGEPLEKGALFSVYPDGSFVQLSSF